MNFEHKRPVTFSRWVLGGWIAFYRQHGWHALTRWPDGRSWREHLMERRQELVQQAREWWHKFWQLAPGGIQ